MNITPFPIQNVDQERTRRDIDRLIRIKEICILEDIIMNRNDEVNKGINQLANLLCAKISYDIGIEIIRYTI
jgi:hypothetical protein